MKLSSVIFPNRRMKPTRRLPDAEQRLEVVLVSQNKNQNVTKRMFVALLNNLSKCDKMQNCSTLQSYYQFPFGVSAFGVPMGFGDFTQRISPIDNHFQLPGLDDVFKNI